MVPKYIVKHYFSCFWKDVLSDQIRSVTQSCPTLLRPHESQHATPPCPSPTPGVHSDSCLLSRWCYPAISSSVVPFSSHLQSFPASGPFQMSHLFASGGQSIRVSASTSLLHYSSYFYSILISSKFMKVCDTRKKVKVTQSCPTLWDPMDYTVLGIVQARILEWVAFPFSRRSSQPRGQTQVSHIAGGFFTTWATRKAQEYWSG